MDTGSFADSRHHLHEPHHQYSRVTPLRVLIVEDDPYARAAVRRYLRYKGYDTVAAASSEEAVSSARHEFPDIIICDWNLGPGGDGCDVARRVQRDHGCRVILMSSHPIDRLKAASQDIDVASYLSKPLSLATLAAVIENVL